MKSTLVSLYIVLFSCIATANQLGREYYLPVDPVLKKMSLADFVWTTRLSDCSNIRRCMNLPSDAGSGSQKTFSKDQKKVAGAERSTDGVASKKGGDPSNGSRDSDEKDGGEEKQKAKEPDYFEMLTIYLKEQLARIGELLEKKRIKMILVFDLDGTLYLSPESFKPSLKRKLNSEQLFKLQQQWFIDFAQFILRYRANLLLIYNTARSYTEDQSITSAGWFIPELSFDSGEGACSLMKFKPHATHGYQESFGWLGIPRPDVYITDYGRYIHFSEAFKQHVNPGQLEKARQQLNQEYFHTEQEVNARVSKDFQLMFYRLNVHPAAIGHTVYVPETVLHRRAFEQELYLEPRRTAICPGLGKGGAEGEIGGIGRELAGRSQQPYVIKGSSTYFSSIANKGSALCLTLELLEPYLESDGFSRENIWEIVFGDSCGDLPMIRPDLEVRAFSTMPEEYMNMREDTFKALNFIWNYREPPYWKLSVVFDKMSLKLWHGDHVETSLNHEKVEESDRLGLVGLLKPVLKKLEDEPEPESEPE